MKIKDLRPATYNPRKITDKQLLMLKKSMLEFGDLSGIVVNVKTGNLVGGHQRVKNLDPSWPIIKQAHKDKTGTIALGYIDTPDGRWTYREVDWPEKKEAAANIAANKHGGDFDLTKLRDIVITLDDGSMNMELIGFNSHELELMMTAVHQEPEDSAIRKNFEDRGLSVDEEPTEMRVDGKYPVTFILDKAEWESWEIVKAGLKIKSDKTAFLKIIGSDNA